jgi:pimeloyl-ACP methyl ester carboxylesterase
VGSLTRFVRAGLTFDVLDRGPADGDPVVLLHGFPDEPACWDAIVPALVAHGYRTLAPEQRGYSALARPTGRAAYRVREVVADVLALLDAAGIRRGHLVGHDWGAVVGWALAGRHPERVRSLTALSVPHPGAFGHGLLAGTQAVRSWYVGLFQVPLLPERLLASQLRGVLRRTGLPQAQAERLAGRMAEPGRLSGALAWYRALPFTVLELFPPSRVPTTFVWGRRDPAVSRAAAEQTRAYVEAPYRLVELGAGHWLPYTHPVEVTAVLLDRLRATSPLR